MQIHVNWMSPLADLLLSVRHLRAIPARWAPVYHTSLVLAEPRQLVLVFGGDKGQGSLWLVPFTSPPDAFTWVAPLMTYEAVYQPGHLDFDYSLAQVLVANDVPYRATRDVFREVCADIEALGLRYDPWRTNCNAVVSTMVGRSGHSLPSPSRRGWFPAYKSVIL